jgi:hypothetical protein
MFCLCGAVGQDQREAALHAAKQIVSAAVVAEGSSWGGNFADLHGKILTPSARVRLFDGWVRPSYPPSLPLFYCAPLLHCALASRASIAARVGPELHNPFMLPLAFVSAEAHARQLRKALGKDEQMHARVYFNPFVSQAKRSSGSVGQCEDLPHPLEIFEAHKKTTSYVSMAVLRNTFDVSPLSVLELSKDHAGVLLGWVLNPRACKRARVNSSVTVLEARHMMKERHGVMDARRSVLHAQFLRGFFAAFHAAANVQGDEAQMTSARTVSHGLTGKSKEGALHVAALAGCGLMRDAPLISELTFEPQWVHLKPSEGDVLVFEAERSFFTFGLPLMEANCGRGASGEFLAAQAIVRPHASNDEIVPTCFQSTSLDSPNAQNLFAGEACAFPESEVPTGDIPEWDDTQADMPEWDDMPQPAAIRPAVVPALARVPEQDEAKPAFSAPAEAKPVLLAVKRMLDDGSFSRTKRVMLSSALDLLTEALRD